MQTCAINGTKESLANGSEFTWEIWKTLIRTDMGKRNANVQKWEYMDTTADKFVCNDVQQDNESSTVVPRISNLLYGDRFNIDK